MSKRKMGSPFLTTPTVVLLPAALVSLGEFKFVARQSFPKEHIVSIEGRIEGTAVYIEEFVENIDYAGDDAGNWLDYADDAITRAKQSAAGKGRQWLGTIHSHCYEKDVTNGPSQTDHVSGHFSGESISAIYTIAQTKKIGRLWSPPIHWFVPQGQISVLKP